MTERKRNVNSDKKEFIIGTEISIAEHLQYMCPDKNFHYLSLKLICPNMKATTLVDLYNCVNGTAGEEIILDEKTITDAKKFIDEIYCIYSTTKLCCIAIKMTLINIRKFCKICATTILTSYIVAHINVKYS